MKVTRFDGYVIVNDGPFYVVYTDKGFPDDYYKKLPFEEIILWGVSDDIFSDFEVWKNILKEKN